jgi:hypothetical protein
MTAEFCREFLNMLRPEYEVDSAEQVPNIMRVTEPIQLCFEFFKLREKKIAALGFAAVFEADEVGFAGRA